MFRILKLASALAVVALLGACAHPVSLSPDMGKILGSGSGKVDRAVALNISDADKQREVIGPGGGGDKISYFPYRDLEAGLYAALSENFASVVSVNGTGDPKLKAQTVHYVVTPVLKTNSSSPSLFTWPPTDFWVDVVCSVTDAQGKAVTEVRVSGHGHAEFDEFKSDFSLAAKRAADDTLVKLVRALHQAKTQLR